VRLALLAAVLASALALPLAARADSSSDAASADQSSTASAGKAKAGELQEVVVTAEKKSERLQDVPVPVTAISAESLISSGYERLQDYFSQVPGLTFTSSTTDLSMVAIRGVITGAVETVNNPSVGIVVDDVPYGSSTALGGGSMAPEFDPSTLQRVEVLRGPQGTLYGASSLGGLIKYVTVDPSTDGVHTQVTGGTSSVHNGAELGYNAYGSVNVPLSGTVAMLASAFTRQDPGYIDNPVLGIRGLNEAHTSGGRLSVLWQPSDSFTLKLGALYQAVHTDGSNFVELALGDLEQNDIRNTGVDHRTFQVYSASMTARLGAATLTSVTGYSVNKLTDAVDYDAGLGFLDGLTQQFLNIPNGTTGVDLLENNRTDKFSQEFRLATPIGSRLDWLLGAFYTHERSPFVQTIAATNPTTGVVLEHWGTFSWAVTFREYAGFTDFTVHITDRFDVQLGGRESRIQQTYAETDTGPFVLPFEGFPSPLVFHEVVTHDNAFTYLLTPRFKVTPDLMVYARIASGYRPGGPNPDAIAFGLPLSYKPDKTTSYELGMKGDTWNHSLTFDASLYYIDWKDIQLSYVDPHNGFGFNANGSRAKSEGFELSSQLKPLTGLTVGAWVAWNHAVLTQPFPPGSAVYGVTGNRLPFSPRFSGNLSVDEEFPITAGVTGFVGGSLSYVGDRVGNFTPPPPTPPPRQDYPAYARTDVRVGAKFASWTADVYVNNLTDRRGILFGGLGTVPNPAAFTYIQPRTVGLLATVKF
jgi:iron complex outermembrane receptor protein